MSIQGRIAIDASFADSDTSTGVQSLKKISLVDSTSYTSGKVAYVTGTVGTALQFISYSDYRNAAGQTQTLSVQRFAFQATPAAQILNDLGAVLCQSEEDVSVDNWRDHVAVKTTAGTASYTLVLYGT